MGGEARDVLRVNLGADPYERIEMLRQAGARRASAAGRLVQMERLREVILAKLRMEYERGFAAEGTTVSEEKLKRLALADERYRKHVNGLAAATEEKELAEVEYWALRAELEWDRAAIAHLNAVARLEDPTP